MLLLKTWPRHSDVTIIVLARGIACSWGLQRGIRWWGVELARVEHNARFVGLAGSMVASKGGTDE